MTDAFWPLAWRLWSRVFVFVLLGAVLGRLSPGKSRVWVRRFAALSIHAIVPVYILALMWRTRVDWGRFALLSVAVAGVLAGGAAGAAALSRRWGKPFREVCLPVVFMNSIYLALPVNALLFGPAGAAATVVFNFVVTAVHFTVGVWWVRRPDRSGWREVLGLPILYAAAAGAALNAAGTPFPAWADGAARGLTAVALPAMLVLIGVRMTDLPRGGWDRAAQGTAVRMLGGAVCGWLCAALLGLEGVERAVVIVTAAMPSAVNTYLLSERFDADPAFAAALVTLGTALSAVTLPLLAWGLGAGG
jgi:predicted permease